MSSNGKSAMNLAVAFHFVNGGKSVNYSWVRFNGGGNTKSETKPLIGIPKKRGEEVATIRAVSAALRDQEKNSKITVYLDNEELSELINYSRDIYAALRKARTKRSEPLRKAIHSLADSIARHKDVTAIFTNANDKEPLRDAKNNAQRRHDDITENKKRPGRKGEGRRPHCC